MDEEEPMPFQEMIIADPETLGNVITACEVLQLGWVCQKEAVPLKGQEGEVEEMAVHFRMTLWANPKIVAAEDIPR